MFFKFNLSFGCRGRGDAPVFCPINKLRSSPHSMDDELNLNSLHAVVKYGSVDVVQKFLQVNNI